jgi:glycosyltransferase involved in cell wall biosynthesis
MKVLVVIPTLQGGGAERVVSLLTQEWAKSHQVIIASFESPNIAYDYGGQIVDLRALTGSVNPLKKAYNTWARSAWIRGMLRREQPDLVISFMEGMNFLAIAAAVSTGYLDRLFVSVHNDPARFSMRNRRLLPWLYRLPARVIAVSDGVKQGLEAMGVPAARVSFIPNPVILKDRQVTENRPEPPLLHPFVLGVGRLAQQKGFDRLLDAFRRLDQSEVHLVILGEGPERARLVGMARELGIEEYVHLPGFVADVDTWYRHAECFVLSSRHEGWAMVLMEAMANGCPVVSFDCKYGPSEILEGGANGLLVPEGDVEALASAMGRVLNDEALRRDLAARGMERAKMSDIKEIAARWLAGA